MVCLTKAGRVAHDAIVTGARERNRPLLEQMSQDDLDLLLGHIDRLTDTAAQMLAAGLTKSPEIRAPDGRHCVGLWRPERPALSGYPDVSGAGKPSK